MLLSLSWSSESSVMVRRRLAIIRRKFAIHSSAWQSFEYARIIRMDVISREDGNVTVGEELLVLIPVSNFNLSRYIYFSFLFFSLSCWHAFVAAAISRLLANYPYRIWMNWTVVGKNVTDYFAGNNWRVHPHWMYCKWVLLKFFC